MLYLPTFPCDVVLSRWTGRPQGLTIDPWGVECFVAPEPPKRRWLRRPSSAPATPAASVHVLAHRELPVGRVRTWVLGQVAQQRLAAASTLSGGELTEAVAAEAERLASVAWAPWTLTIDAVPRDATLLAGEIWGGVVELDDVTLGVLGRGIAPEEVALRGADAVETRELRQAALRV